MGVFLALGVCFFGSMVGAALLFPQPYDWRRTVLSSLASPKDNPQLYGLACAGLAISGLLLMPFAFFLQRRLTPFAPGPTAWAGKFFLLGAAGLTLTAVIVPGHYRVFGLGRTHEHLAQVTSVAFCLALLLYFAAVLHLPRRFFIRRVLAGFVILLPVTALAVSRVSLLGAYLFAAPAVYRAVRASLWSSLSIWEWLGAVCVYLFLGLMTLGWPEANADSLP